MHGIIRKSLLVPQNVHDLARTGLRTTPEDVFKFSHFVVEVFELKLPL